MLALFATIGYEYSCSNTNKVDLTMSNNVVIIFGAVTVSFEMIATVWWEIFSTKCLYIQLESISLMNCKFKNLSWPGPFSKSFFSVELNYSTKKFSPRWLFLMINPLFLDQCCKAPKCSGFEDNNIFNQKDDSSEHTLDLDLHIKTKSN